MCKAIETLRDWAERVHRESLASYERRQVRSFGAVVGAPCEQCGCQCFHVEKAPGGRHYDCCRCGARTWGAS